MKHLGHIATEGVKGTYFQCRGVFPFDFFPNVVTLDGTAIHFIYRKFFNIQERVTWQIKDVLAVEITEGPFFASLTFSNRFFTDQHRVINWLWRKDAVEMREKVTALITRVQEP